MSDNKIAIILDEDFATKHIPPFPKPSFISFENPLRIASILNHLNHHDVFKNDRIIKIEPKIPSESVIEMAHSKYHIDAIRRISQTGGGLLDDEVFVTEDTFDLAKKAVGGAIQAIESVIKGQFNQSFALIRPPGHHALRETASGLCIFNNIANAILYARTQLNYNEKIAIIDIDNHFGDGLAQYFYQDPTVLYCSIHEYDFSEGDLGMIDELGAGEGIGKNVNFPILSGSTNEDFLDGVDLFDILLEKFEPDLIMVATGFDMYFADPIGSCSLTSKAYYQFTKKLIRLSQKICKGRVAFILEGGYSIIGLPYCVHSVIKAMLDEEFEAPEFESAPSCIPQQNKEEIKKIKDILLKLLEPYWDF